MKRLVLTVLETAGSEWCVAGISLFADERHYWGLHLAASPEAKGRRLGTEMQEMLDGEWLAQFQTAKLDSLPGQKGFEWKPGKTYRMEIRLAEAFWFCRSAIGGDSADDVVDEPDVPNYYRQAHFITDAKRGGCFGALHQTDGWHVTFWKDPGGSIHPDSRIRVDRELKPGERRTAEGVPSLAVFASSRRDAWKEAGETANRP